MDAAVAKAYASNNRPFLMLTDPEKFPHESRKNYPGASTKWTFDQIGNEGYDEEIVRLLTCAVAINHQHYPLSVVYRRN